MEHVDAARVLPRAVLRDVQRWFCGGYLWVGRAPLLAERNNAIRRRRAQGETVKDLAARFGLTTRRVRRIPRKDTEFDTELGRSRETREVEASAEGRAGARTLA